MGPRRGWQESHRPGCALLAPGESHRATIGRAVVAAELFSSRGYSRLIRAKRHIAIPSHPCYRPTRGRSRKLETTKRPVRYVRITQTFPFALSCFRDPFHFDDNTAPNIGTFPSHLATGGPARYTLGILEGIRMVRSLIRNQMPVYRLRVRLPCPPLPNHL